MVKDFHVSNLKFIITHAVFYCYNHLKNIWNRISPLGAESKFVVFQKWPRMLLNFKL